MKHTDIKKYSLHSSEQNQQDVKFWKEQSFEYKLKVLEAIRQSAEKLTAETGNTCPDSNRNQQRLRRVLRIIEQE